MDIVMPQLGETVDKGTVTAWHKAPGERVAASETLFEVSTDKVDTEIPAPASGILRTILVPEGETVAVGVVIGVIEADEEAGEAPAAMRPAQATPVAPPPAPRRARPARRDGRRLSPVVRRLLAEHGIAPEAVAGTGAEGRITRRDVLAHLARGERETRGPAVRAVIPFGTIRKRTAEHMLRSKAVSPHVLQAVEADFDRVERARRAHGEAWAAREGFSLTYLPFVAQALCAAIVDYPNVNARIDGESLVVYATVNLAIAVDLGFEGLVAPVIRGAETLSLAELARAIHHAATGARTGRLGPDDYADGTYTVSNAGTYGTLITAPIINQPQVAILSTDGVKKRPVVVETESGDAIAIRPVGVLAQSFDHRAFDGAYSAAFLRRLKEVLETRDWTAALA